MINVPEDPTTESIEAAMTTALGLTGLDPRRVIVPAIVSADDVAAWFGCTKSLAYKLLTKLRAHGLKTAGVRGRYFSADVKKYIKKLE